MEVAIRATTGPTIYVSSCTMLESAVGSLVLFSLSFPRSAVRVTLGCSNSAVVTLCPSLVCSLGMLAVLVGREVSVLSGGRGFSVVDSNGVVSVAGFIESTVVERQSSVWLERQVAGCLVHLKFSLVLVDGQMLRKVVKSMLLHMHW